MTSWRIIQFFKRLKFLKMFLQNMPTVSKGITKKSKSEVDIVIAFATLQPTKALI